MLGTKVSYHELKICIGSAILIVLFTYYPYPYNLRFFQSFYNFRNKLRVLIKLLI